MAATDTGLRDVSARHDLLQHSFYVRWTEGTLTRAELADYAGQYAHVVAALPRWLEQASASTPRHADALSRHAREEATHVALWDRFTRAIDAEAVPAAPNPATRALIDRGDALAASGQATAVAWAVEAQAPEVSQAKLDGLTRHYGIGPISGAQYFDVHRSRDITHRAELESILAEADPDATTRAAELVMEGLWDLLTSVEVPPGV